MSMSEILKGALSESSHKVEKALSKLSMFHSGNEQAGLCAYSLNAGKARENLAISLLSDIRLYFWCDHWLWRWLLLI